MSKDKLKIAKTAADNLIGNLRGEIGEIITSWILLRDLLPHSYINDEEIKDISKLSLEKIKTQILTEKLKSDIVARLYELSKDKTGRLNFSFAAKKLKIDIPELKSYRKFLVTNKFRDKRNNEISHKELPEQWNQHKNIRISYKNIVKAVAMALRIMKGIDSVFLGPRAKYLWQRMRTKRYNLIHPPKVAYLLLPQFRLDEETRIKILEEEQKEGKTVWQEMSVTVNGEKEKILANKEFGVILFNGCYMPLRDYPIQEVSINFEQNTNST